MQNCKEHTENDIVILFDKAKQLFEDESIEECKIHLSHIINFHENNNFVKEALFLFGKCSIVEKNLTNSLRYFELALKKINIDRDQLLFLELMDNIGYCYIELGEYEKAFSSFKKGEKYLSLWDDAKSINRKLWYMFAIGKCLHAQIKYSEALCEFKKIEKLLSLLSANEDENSLISVTYFCIGREYLFLEKISDAEKYLELTNPEYLSESFKHNYYSLMVLLRLYQNDFSKVIEEFQLYKQIGIPDYNKAVVYDWVGRAYYLLKNNKKAKRYFKNSLKYEDEDKKAHEDAMAYLEKLSMSENRYIELFRVQNILTATSFLFIYLSLRIDIVLLLFNSLSPYQVILDSFWIIPLLISIMISLYLKKWKNIGNKWYSKLDLKDKLRFYSMYIFVLFVVILLELLF